MNITIKKMTGIEEAHAAIEATMFDGFEAKASLSSIYNWEHSPSRTQIFWIEMINIFRGVSDHLVRHAAVGQQHFIKSSRTSHGGVGWGETSLTSFTDHRMLINAQHLIDMAKLRLCYKANANTRTIMIMIKEQMKQVDPALAEYLVPKCVYRNGICSEPSPCGIYNVEKYNPSEIWERIK